jgi:hypothetical protein
MIITRAMIDVFGQAWNDVARAGAPFDTRRRAGLEAVRKLIERDFIVIKRRTPPPEPIEDKVTADLLVSMVEQPEPSVNGDWYMVSLETLLANGYTYVQVHFPDDDQMTPNGMILVKATDDE